MARKGLKFDVALCMGVLALVGLGLVLIYSSSAALAVGKGLPESFYLQQHFKKLVVGMIALLVGMSVPYKFWERMAWPLLAVILCMLLYIVVTGVGRINGASRWVFGIQPSEFGKLFLIIFLARRLTEKAANMPYLGKGLIPSLIVPGVMMALIVLQPNYSMVLMLCGITVAMVFAAGSRVKHLLLVSAAILPLILLLLMTSSHSQKRIAAFFDPSANTGGSHQSQHALISLGSGGLIGTGLGEGTQKLGYLPMPFTDTVFAILGEELGFIGTLGVLCLFGLVVWRGLRVARSCPDGFGSLLAAGISVSIAISVMVHVGVCVKFFPTTGQPLPFVSYGGTSLIVNLLAMGILLNISETSAVPVEPPPPLVWRAARRTSPLRPFRPERGRA